MWEWAVGVGEISEMDDKGRITLPVNIRRIVEKDAFKIELAGRDTIILKALEDKHELVEKIRKIKLAGDRKRARLDAALAKDKVGGVKD